MEIKGRREAGFTRERAIPRGDVRQLRIEKKEANRLTAIIGWNARPTERPALIFLRGRLEPRLE